MVGGILLYIHLCGSIQYGLDHACMVLASLSLLACTREHDQVNSIFMRDVGEYPDSCNGSLTGKMDLLIVDSIAEKVKLLL